MKLSINNRETNIDAGTPLTVSTLIEHLELNRMQIAIEVNEELIPRENHADCVLNDGDQIEVVTLVGGG